MIRAFAYGIGIISLQAALWLLLLATRSSLLAHNEWLQIFSIIPAFITAYLAPREKIFSGISMAIFSAMISVVSQRMGRGLDILIDDVGDGIFAWVLAASLPQCVLGASLGYFCSVTFGKEKANLTATIYATNQLRIRAWMAGFWVILIGQIFWFITLNSSNFRPSDTIGKLFWICPVIASFLSVFLTQDRRIRIGISLAIPATILMIIVNRIENFMSLPADYGLKSTFLPLVLLTCNLFFCTVGAAIAFVCSRETLDRLRA